MTQRFASSMVFMSLLLSAELGVLFNSSRITTEMRTAMMNQAHTDLKFYIGVLVVLSVFLTLFTLIATFCAWGMVSAVSNCNAHCVLRSSIGQYVAQLPSRLLVSSVYCFIIWMSLWVFELLPGLGSKLMLATMGTLFVHIITSFSSFGRLMMLSGAMGSERILDEEFEQALLPSGLHTALLLKATDRMKRRLTVTAQYSSRRFQEQSCISSNGVAETVSPPHHRRDDTMNSDVENYMIEKTANAFSKRSVQLDPDVMATAPVVPPIVSPVDDTEAKNDNNSTALNEEWTHRSSIDMNRTDKAMPNERSSVISAASDATASSFDKNYFAGSHSSVHVHASPPSRRPFFQRTAARRRFGRFNKSMAEREWDNDEEARSMYNRPPAAKFDNKEESMLPSTLLVGGRRLPRASVLNTANHSRNSISRLTVDITHGEDGGEVKQSQQQAVTSSTGGLLTGVANRGMEPFAHFISRLNGKDAACSEESNGRASLVIMKEDAGANVGESLERGEASTPGSDVEYDTAPETLHLLGDSSPKRTAYSSQVNEVRQAYPLSPIESIGDLEELHRESSPQRTDGNMRLSK
mmetsp:Transcript_37024/g.81126  ORF Transcript_37024/g.81126 Transcript_37024/m.81126 type:complete len:580 (+) Transcript_37024:378-2117(+)